MMPFFISFYLFILIGLKILTTKIKLLQVEVTDAALLALIDNYCRESGVRNLQKQIEKIYRKVCRCNFFRSTVSNFQVEKTWLKLLICFF